MKFILFLSCSLLIQVFTVNAQQTFDNKYLRITSDNDNWRRYGHSDRYYTNGIRIEYMSKKLINPEGFKARMKQPFLKKMKFFLQLENPTNSLYSIGLGQDMFTPADITRQDIIRLDRPYAGYLYGFLKKMTSDYEKRRRITSEIIIGVIGPLAFGDQVQTFVHSLDVAPEPQGWHHQIENDLGVNYNVTYEFVPQVFEDANILDFIANVHAKTGTVWNEFGIGSTFRFGRADDYFLSDINGVSFSKSQRKQLQEDKNIALDPRKKGNDFQMFSFFRTQLNAVLSNSTLQGGVISQERSPHILDADLINRIYFQGEFGLVISITRFSFTYSQFFRTPEFQGANTSYWGRFAITARISK